MIIPDVNILVYAYDATSVFHQKSKGWWEETLRSGEPVALPWAVVLGFLRLVTHPRIFQNPLTVEAALGVVQDWMAQPTVTCLDPGPRHWLILKNNLIRVSVGGKLVSDAHLAALALEYRSTLSTNDRDFERFPGISLFNPVA